MCVAHARDVDFDDFAQAELLRRLPIDASFFDEIGEFFPCLGRTISRHEGALDFVVMLADFPQMFPIGDG